MMPPLPHPTGLLGPVRWRLLLALLLLALLLAPDAHAQFTNGQAAFRVLGQADFTTSTQSGTSATTLDGSSGICIDLANGKMYVVDEDDHRVLRYAYPLTGDQQAAEAVLGQPDFTTSSSGTTAATMGLPSGCAVGSGGVLFIGDGSNHRVLRFDNAHTKTSGADADGVLGQADFTTNTAATTAAGMAFIEGLALDGSGRLYVADRNNRRVLRFDDAASKSNGAAADGVLGQADFTTNTSATTATGMSSVYDVAVDGNGRLYVADQSNNRVLRFDDAASKSNGATADGVLGQANFTTNTNATTATGMNWPVGVAVDGSGRLYVAGASNNRVLLFDDAASKSNGAAADGVLGQANFTTRTFATTATGMSLNFRSDIAVDGTNNRIYVSDTNNNRVLGYQGSSALPVELTHFTATLSSTSVHLAWRTASETNNAGFALEHQAPTATSWAEAAFIEGHGTTLAAQSYQHTLSGLPPGTHRFRLKQIDYDGTFEYSPEVEVTIELAQQYSLSTAYPNPFHAETVFTLAVQQSQAVRVAVYDALGREVVLLHEGRLASDEAHRFVVDGSRWSPGIYMVRVQGEQLSAARPLTLVR